MAEPTRIESESDIDHLLDGFRRRTLPESSWTHQAHLVVGLCTVMECGPYAALGRLRQEIRAYNEATGGRNTETEGYHETITRFFVLALDAHNRAQPTHASRLERVGTLLASPLSDKQIVLEHYRRETIDSNEARAHWVEPDLMAGPWTRALPLPRRRG